MPLSVNKWFYTPPSTSGLGTPLTKTDLGTPTDVGTYKKFHPQDFSAIWTARLIESLGFNRLFTVVEV